MENRIQPVDFRYFLRKKNGTDYDYYYVNSSGVVSITTSATPVNPLKHAPDGRESQSLIWERGLNYWGVFRAYTVPMEYVLDAAKILRYVYFNQGVEGDLELYVELFNRDETIWDYEAYYAGDIDFSQINDQKDKVTTRSAESGFLSKFKAHEASDYEFDIENNADVIWVFMHGINLQFRQTWISVDGESLVSAGGKFPSFFAAVSEGTNIYLDILDHVASDPVPKLIHNSSAVARTFDIQYDYNYNAFLDGGVLYDGYFRVQILTFNTTTSLYTGAHVVFLSSVPLSPGSSATYVGSGTATITLQPDQVVRLRCNMLYYNSGAFLYGDPDYDVDQIHSKLTLTLDNKVPEGYIPVLRAKKVYDSLIDSMNDGDPVTATSDMLGTTHEDKVITSGDAARNLPNSKMKVNFQEFYKSMNAIFGTSFRYSKDDNETFLEEKVTALQDTEIIDLGDISELQITPLTEEMFSKLKNGYDNFTYDNVNGKDEFNNETERQMPIVRITSERDLKSKIRTDMYGIELIRLNLAGKEITDSDSDNDLWMLHIESTSAGTVPDGLPGAGQPYYNLYRDAGLTITNIYSPDTAFNIFFSPARCLLRNGDWLHSICDNLDSKHIKFQTNSKSNYTATKMVTDDGVNIIDEGADILVSDLSNKIFKPYVFEFRTMVPVNIYVVMNTNPYGKVKFMWKDEEYYGYILKVSQEPTYNAPQQFKLISHPDNDLTKLIY